MHSQSRGRRDHLYGRCAVAGAATHLPPAESLPARAAVNVTSPGHARAAAPRARPSCADGRLLGGMLMATAYRRPAGPSPRELREQLADPERLCLALGLEHRVLREGRVLATCPWHEDHHPWLDVVTSDKSPTR